ncbi:hypothetical protein SAMN04488523_10968 [Sulfitobacter brevis]|uniref:Uncharacterized protein n=1 Tax=Sulfitobacter brevis TaxID=74348 RepID=A0A1I2CBL9_9RHOB|nr:DUF5337 domain-containing protein [Sulfitobacter brevis]SFE65721.1 hypothetical protein SAMN04488523_10968 [Sulfitobacter brevis]
MSDEQDRALARKGQTAGLVIAGTMVLWLVAPMAARKFGLPGHYALLFDFAALAAMVWALVVIYQMWRARQAQKDNQR